MEIHMYLMQFILAFFMIQCHIFNARLYFTIHKILHKEFINFLKTRLRKMTFEKNVS